MTAAARPRCEPPLKALEREAESATPEKVAASPTVRASGNGRIEVDTAGLYAVADPNGRARSPVSVSVKAPSEKILHTDSINVVAAKDRERFVAALPEEWRVEASDLLIALSSRVMNAAHRKAKAPASGESFPETEPWDHEVAGDVLLDELRALITSYMVIPPAAADAIALWLVHTYLLDIADFTPYLLITSPVRECGKSTLLDLLVPLASHAKKTDGITAAALYRTIEKFRPTMFLDEMDTRLRGDSGELLRGVLNSGFERSGNVTICVGDDHETREFSTFCPKVLAGIGRVWDTVASRSIPIRLNRASKSELAGLSKIRGDRIAAACLAYRRRAVRWASDARDEVRDCDPAVPAELGARHGDIWRPLFAIADTAAGRWPDAARVAAVALHRAGADEGDIGLLLLEDLRTVFAADRRPVVPSADVVTALLRMEGRPWPEYRNDKPITANGLARLLKRFNVRPGVHRVSPVLTARGYALSEFEKLFATYLPSEGDGAEPIGPTIAAVTDVTVETGGDADDNRGEAWESEELAFDAE